MERFPNTPSKRRDGLGVDSRKEGVLTMNKRRYQVLALVLVLMTLATTAYAAFIVSREIEMSASIQVSGGMRVYSDAATTTEITAYTWPTIDNSAGMTMINKSLWIKNEGNIPVFLIYSLTNFGSWTTSWGGRYNGAGFYFQLFNNATGTVMLSADDTTPVATSIAMGAVLMVRMELTADAAATPADNIASFQIVFDAYDDAAMTP